jgi:hypothetical protein
LNFSRVHLTGLLARTARFFEHCIGVVFGRITDFHNKFNNNYK